MDPGHLADSRLSTPVDLSVLGPELRELCEAIQMDAETLGLWVETSPDELTIGMALLIRMLCHRVSRVRHLMQIAVRHA